MTRARTKKPVRDLLGLVRNHLAWQFIALHAGLWQLINPKKLTERIELFGPKAIVETVGGTGWPGC